MSILQEIRRQPLWAREVMFALSVIITVSAVGTLWFHSFQHDMIALGNPGVDVDQKFFVQRDSSFSPLALISRGVGFMRANVYSFLNIDEGDDKASVKVQAVYPLPLAPDRTE